MKSVLHTIFISSFLFLCVVFVADASTVLRTGDKVLLGADQVVEDDFYAAAGPVLLSGTIMGDAHIVGSSITTNGEIGSDLFVLGGSVQVHASVTDDIRVVGGEITIAEHVGGDVFIIGGTLTVLSTARIEGDIFFYGGEAEVNGEVAGGIHGISESLRIDGIVGGDVDVQVGTLSVGDRASIDGDVQYKSSNELIRAQNAVIVGQVIRNELSDQNTNPREFFVPFLIYAFSVLLVYAVFRKSVQSLLINTIDHFTKNGLIGLGGAIFIPGLIVLSFVTVIGSVIGFALFFASVAVWIGAVLLLGMFAGQLVLRAMNKPCDVSLLPTIGGIVAVSLVSLIPVVGPVLLLVATLSLFGGIIHTIYTKIS